MSESPTPPQPSMQEIVAFLLGEGPLNGLWFGDDIPMKGRYWWRSILRDALRSETGTKHAVTEEMYDAGLRYLRGRGTGWCVTDLYLAMEDARVK